MRCPCRYEHCVAFILYDRVTFHSVLLQQPSTELLIEVHLLVVDRVVVVRGLLPVLREDLGGWRGMLNTLAKKKHFPMLVLEVT